MTLTPEMVESERAAFEAAELLGYLPGSPQRELFVEGWLARAQSQRHIGYIDTGELSIIALDEPNMAGHITLASSPNQYEDTPVYIFSPHAQSQRAVPVAELEALVGRWSNTDEHFGDDHGKAMTECADELSSLIDRAGGGA